MSHGHQRWTVTKGFAIGWSVSGWSVSAWSVTAWSVCRWTALACAVLLSAATQPVSSASEDAVTRTMTPLSGPQWQFIGGVDSLPDIASDAFVHAAWTSVSVPHVFQHRTDATLLTMGWYRTRIDLPASAAGKELYIVCEGAATTAAVYVNGTQIGSHVGAYTRFIADATAALHPGPGNELAIRVDDSAEAKRESLPCANGLYWVWGGLYRKVWLLATDRRHIDPTDDAAPGAYILPHLPDDVHGVLDMRVLLRNCSPSPWAAGVQADVLDESGATVASAHVTADVPAQGRSIVPMTTTVDHPLHWHPDAPHLYHVRFTVSADGQPVDRITQPTGFRTLVFSTATRTVTLDGERILLQGPDLHQEVETHAAAVTDADLLENMDHLQDLGANFVRFSHYPRAQLEYDACDSRGLFCWTENGNSSKADRDSPSTERITRELVKQNYNHPSIALWSVGNESSAGPADAFAAVVRTLDRSRPVVAANMHCPEADFVAANTYDGWYGGKTQEAMWSFKGHGYTSETGAGGVTTSHANYATASWKVNSYEPEEYQSLFAEQRFQAIFRNETPHVGLFCWWVMRDLCDHKYHNTRPKPIWNGENTKGLETYDGQPKDAYFLYRCFAHPGVVTVHIASQRYFLRRGDPRNGIKVYSNAPRLTLRIAGAVVGSQERGAYHQPSGHPVDDVFWWQVPLHQGLNAVVADDGAGHSDRCLLYAAGPGFLPPVPHAPDLVTGLPAIDPDRPLLYVAIQPRPDWPIYTDIDGSADDSFADLPPVLQGCGWIATPSPRHAPDGQGTGYGFGVRRPCQAFILCTAGSSAAALAQQAGFAPLPQPGLQWHDDLQLRVDASLFQRHLQPGDQVAIPDHRSSLVVLLKEDRPLDPAAP
jgi:beta-galactosidase